MCMLAERKLIKFFMSKCSHAIFVYGMNDEFGRLNYSLFGIVFSVYGKMQIVTIKWWLYSVTIHSNLSTSPSYVTIQWIWTSNFSRSIASYRKLFYYFNFQFESIIQWEIGNSGQVLKASNFCVENNSKSNLFLSMWRDLKLESESES